jgi:hypothetical protein
MNARILLLVSVEITEACPAKSRKEIEDIVANAVGRITGAHEPQVEIAIINPLIGETPRV